MGVLSDYNSLLEIAAILNISHAFFGDSRGMYVEKMSEISHQTLGRIGKLSSTYPIPIVHGYIRKHEDSIRAKLNGKEIEEKKSLRIYQSFYSKITIVLCFVSISLLLVAW